MTVTNAWQGAVTSSAIRVRAKVTGSSTRLAVDTDPALGSPTYFGPVTPSNSIATLDATGLDPVTQYYWAVEDDGVLDATFPGQFRTLPVADEPADFFFAAIGDAGLSPDVPGVGTLLASTRMSNHGQFDTVRQRDPDFVVHLGDMHYYDLGSGSHGIAGGSSVSNYRRAYDDVLLQPLQHQLYREVPIAYCWDDHDYGPNNSDRTHTGRANARQVYRERVPHYTLPAGSGDNPIYQSFQVGRVLFILSDIRSERDPDSDPKSPSKTMLGTAQKSWMETLLGSTSAEALVWLGAGQWMNDESNDSWFGFAHERDELVQMFGDLGWLRRMCFVGADVHSLAIDTGKGNRWGGFPVFQVAGIDATPSSPSGSFDLGSDPGRDARGEFRIRDHGHTIEVEGTTWSGDAALFKGHTWQAVVGRQVFALDYEAGHISPPFEPIADDQSLRNAVTAQRSNGGSYEVVHSDGPLSVSAPPDGVGTYDEQVTVNVQRDEQLPDQAGWRVRKGTVDADRYPMVHVDLDRNSALAPDFAGVETGDAVTIANTPDWLPPEDLALIFLGYTETIHSFGRNVEINAAPAEPWTIGEVVATPQDAGTASPNRVDTSGSVLVGAIDDDDTTLLVLTEQDATPDGSAVWVTSDGPIPTSGI